jgi:hypothetical protein
LILFSVRKERFYPTALKIFLDFFEGAAISPLIEAISHLPSKGSGLMLAPQTAEVSHLAKP